VYVVEAAEMVACLWDDSGSGGAPGSLWTGNSLNCFRVIKGHEAPAEPFFEMKGERFKLGPLAKWTAPPKVSISGTHKEGTAADHKWLENNKAWTRNAKGWVSEMYKPTGSNGPATNLVDNNLVTCWNAGSATKEQWVIFDFKSPVELSAFKYHRQDSPEAPKECELRVRSGKGWTSVLNWTGEKGKGWSKEMMFHKPTRGVEWMFFVKNTHAEMNFFGSVNKAQAAMVAQVLFHGKVME